MSDAQMAGYGPAAMVRTPWGDAAQLREKMLRPGRGTPREEAERNQRERLFAAMVATVAEKGYEGTTVADLVELSGVSRSAFYRHFDDKQACFLAAIEAVVEPTLKRIAGDERVPGRHRAGQAGLRIADQVDRRPARGLEDVLRRGLRRRPRGGGSDRPHDGVDRGARQAAARSDAGAGGDAPEIVRAIVGGIQKVIHKRLYRGQEDELLELIPQLWDWVFCYPVPPGPLRATRRRSVHTLSFAERQAQANPPERILRALAAVVGEKGYPDTTVAEIVERAETSQRTFYEHFANKEDAIVAALDSSSSHMLASALPAFRRAPDWAHAVRGTLEAMFTFGAEEPEYARLGGVEMYAAGKRALDQREVVTEGMEGLLAPGYELSPETPAIAAEGVGGALYSLLYNQVNKKGPESLPDMVPTVVYVTLAPFLSAEDAYAVAVE